MNRWFLSCDFHTLSFMQARLQFPFAFRRIQSLQLLPPAHPCFLACAFWLLWAQLLSARPSLSFVSFLLASGYSASCSSFQLSSRFSSQRLSGAQRFLSSPLSFPLFPAWFPMPSFRFCLLSIPVLFPFVLPCFAPAAVRQVLISRFHSRCFSITSAFFRSLPL